MTEREIFVAAYQRPDPADRRRYLDEACGTDADLRRRVDNLIGLAEGAGSFLEHPAVPPPGPGAETASFSPGSDTAPAESLDAGTQIGPYRLVELIGEGGMGAVYLARQTEPVKRLVALKVIKAGMDSRQVLARFEAERQALALMDHPNIARVLDAGLAGVVAGVPPSGGAPEDRLKAGLQQGGRPYFVMELVKGIPITRFCDERRLTPRERLELFIPVCHAIQHAHQKGVIHRDVKPSNVLVALYDGKPVPKVIDFGVAKAAGQPLTEKTLVTGLGAVVGTPEYMSPEQAELNQLDIDTRSDIYSLGILLYELLTGTTPLTRKRIRDAALLELLRVIREEEPQKPSTRISTTDELPSIAANRGTEPARLTRQLRGELDWIVMKALEKDRARRYETANGFAMDVQRYLADEPVSAGPPSVVYRLRKFARRNRGSVVAVSLVCLALVCGFIGTTFGLVRAEQRAAGEREARDTAEKRLAQFEKGIDLLGSLFADLDPFAEEKEGRPLRAILRDRLDQTAAALEGEAIGDPLVVARLQDRLGHTYLGLGEPRRAEALFSKGIATRQAELGPDHPLTLASRHNQALAFEAAGKRIEAIKRFEQVWTARLKVLGANHPDTLSTQHEMAALYSRTGKRIEAISLLEQVLDQRVQRLGEDHDQTLAALQDLALAYLIAGKHPEAIALAEKLRDARVRKHGDVHPHAIDALDRLAYVYQAAYRMKAALELYKQAQDLTLLKLGPNHPLTLKIQWGLAHMHRVYRKTPEAIDLFERVRDRQVMILGGHHPATLLTLWDLAMAYQDAGELNKALSLFQQAAIGVEKLEYAHGSADRVIDSLARCHERLEQYGEADLWRRKWLPVAKEKFGPESFEYAAFLGLAGLGSNLVQQKKYVEAEPIVRESLAILQKFPGWDACRAESLLGAVLLGQQKYADAETHLVRGYEGLKKLVKNKEHSNSFVRRHLAEALERLVQLYEATKKQDEAAKWRKELESLHKNRAAPMQSKGK
jgi:serine/threonine protein kinase/tetratricopeptide (TPR) repeat protein